MTDFTSHNDVVAALGAAQEADTDNRDAAREAHLFIDKRDGQWEPYWWTQNANRPRYTFDMTGPVVDQIAGEIELADFDIAIKPAGGDADKDDAKLYDGLVRNIESVSNSVDIFNMAARSMVTGGLDGWMVKQKYLDGDSFDQDLSIERIANYLDSVWFLPFNEPDASDAKGCFVLEAIATAEYEERWPEGGKQSVDQNRTGEAYYHKEEHIVVGQFYYIKQVSRTLLQLSSGAVVEEEETRPILDELAQQGITVVGTRVRKKDVVMSRLFDAGDWLNEPQETVFHMLPVIPVMANFKVFENKILYRGAVEKLMDPQRVFNYSKSREIEEGAMAPRAKYWATLEQTAGHEKTMATLNTNADPVQHYNPDPKAPGAPQQQGGAQINPGLKTLSDDMQLIVNQTAGLFAANMGDNPNAQSGIAIKRLQDKGDTGTVKYFKALERAISRTGCILVDAIPRVYDTPRQLRIMKEDGAYDMTAVNQPVMDQQTGRMIKMNDLSKGKYDVTCSAGPSFQSRQEETVSAIVEMGSVDPTVVEMGGDVLFSNISSPGMDLIAERKRKQLFEAGIIPDDQLTDEEKQIQQQKAQEPPPPDPMMVAAQAEADKAKADQDKVVVDMQIAQSKEARENWVAEQKAQAERHEQQLEGAKLRQSAQGQQFDHMMAQQQAVIDKLSSQANTLKTLVDAQATREAAEQATLVTEAQDGTE